MGIAGARPGAEHPGLVGGCRPRHPGKGANAVLLVSNCDVIDGCCDVCTAFVCTVQYPKYSRVKYSVQQHHSRCRLYHHLLLEGIFCMWCVRVSALF